MKCFASVLMIMVAIIVSTANAQEIKKSVSQHTWWAVNESESELVELTDLCEPDFPSYTTITIYRNGKKIFSFHDPKGEFYGDNIFTEHRFSNGKESYLIFRCSDRPSNDYFFVLHKSESGYTQLGFTPNISAEIFGDIDYDDVFEIGGFGLHEVGGDTIEETLKVIANDYKIIEVRPGFPLDKPLMDALLPIVIKSYHEKLQSSKELKK